MKRNKGFTLMEMLIVVAAISILTAIAFPNLRNAKTRAGVMADIQNVSAAYAEAKAEYDIKGTLDKFVPQGGWPVMEENCPGNNIDSEEYKKLYRELYGLELGDGWLKGQTVTITYNDEEGYFEANYSH